LSSVRAEASSVREKRKDKKGTLLATESFLLCDDSLKEEEEEEGVYSSRV